jgi:hypothetical protein
MFATRSTNMADEELPRWARPTPFGRAAAADTMSGVASPLLAGFSITLVGVVAQAPDAFRYPGVTLVLLTVTAVLMVACVQLGFRARSVIYSQADIESWWPASDRTDPITERDLRSLQRSDFEKWVNYRNVARRF